MSDFLPAPKLNTQCRLGLSKATAHELCGEIFFGKEVVRELSSADFFPLIRKCTT